MPYVYIIIIIHASNVCNCVFVLFFRYLSLFVQEMTRPTEREREKERASVREILILADAKPGGPGAPRSKCSP